MGESVNEKAINTSNPIGDEVMVEVAMPKSFKIKMVEASKLTDFKIWGAIFSLLTNIFVGFLVASITNDIETMFIMVDYGHICLTCCWCISNDNHDK